MSNTIGTKIKLTIFGESHGASIGCVLDGLPAGVELDLEAIRREMARRAPGQNLLSTARQEKDAFIIQSGFFEGRTTGTALCAIIPNTDAHSKDYSQLKNLMRPGHADYSAYVHYHGFNDYRGGGSFSGRLTAPLVLAGAVAKQILAARNITVGAHIATIRYVEDTAFNPLGESEDTLARLAQMTLPVLEAERGKAMEEVILAARAQKDSVGGIIECMVLGVPAGVGSPYFASVESKLAQMLFSVPAVKGVEFGQGFALTEDLGSKANDAMQMVEGRVETTTNNNGGIIGGITNGMPLIFRVGIKPTPSIALEQATVNVATGENARLTIVGRHDPCIVPRAVPVIEAVTAWTVLDCILMNGEC